MNKIYTKPAVEITALNAEDIIMASTAELTKVLVGGKDATSYGAKTFNEVFGNIN